MTPRTATLLLHPRKKGGAEKITHDRNAQSTTHGDGQSRLPVVLTAIDAMSDGGRIGPKGEGGAAGTTPPSPSPPATPGSTSANASNAANSAAASDVASMVKNSKSKPAASTAAAAPAPPRAIPAGLRPLLYVGIPESVLRWKPRPPSRNWSIFLAVTSSLTAAYVYDRRECKRIRQEYIDQVQHLGEQPLLPWDYPRKIQVYGAKSPGDDDYDKSIRYFKRYVRPILVAGGIDWEILNGMRHGGLGRELRERIYSRRRQLLGLEPWGTQPSKPAGPIGPPSPESPEGAALAAAQQLQFALTPQQQMQRELDGAVVVIGRPAYKEYMWGLKQGWTTDVPAQRGDLDEPIAKALEGDGAFDEIVAEAPQDTAEPPSASATPPPSTTSASPADTRPLDALDEIERRNRLLAESADDDEGAPLPSSRVAVGSPFASGGQKTFQSSPSPSPPSSSAPSISPSLLLPPTSVPAQPPLVYVPFTNLTGWRQMPRRMYNFFNRRADVRAGGDAALSILLGDKSTARGFNADDADAERPLRQHGDFIWGATSERTYPPRFHKLPQTIAEARASYYKDLPQRLKDSRSYYRGERELTATEKNDPPKSETELREGRLRREREWRNEEDAFEVLREESGVEWDQRFSGSLRVLESEGQARRREAEEKSVREGEERERAAMGV